MIWNKTVWNCELSSPPVLKSYWSSAYSSSCFSAWSCVDRRSCLLTFPSTSSSDSSHDCRSDSSSDLHSDCPSDCQKHSTIERINSIFHPLHSHLLYFTIYCHPLKYMVMNSHTPAGTAVLEMPQCHLIVVTKKVYSQKTFFTKKFFHPETFFY